MGKLLRCFLVFILLFTSIDFQVFASEKEKENEVVGQLEEEDRSNEAERIRELEELRESNSKTYLNSDGTYTTDIYTEDIHYEKDGELEVISNTPQENNESDKNDFKFVNKDNRFKVKFATKSNKKDLITIKLGKEKINYKLLDTKSVSAKKEEGIVIYENIFKNVDFEYSIGNSSVKEDIILKKKNAHKEFQFLITGTLIPKKEERNINFYNKENKLIWTMPHPFMEDKNGKYSEEIDFTVTEREDGFLLTLLPNTEFLNAKDTVYPVRIDPTVNIGGKSSNTLDSYVMKNYPNNNYYLTPELRSGYTSSTGVTRTYMDFSDSLPNLSGKLLVKAELNLYKWDDIGSTISTKVYANRITKNWDSTTITFNNQPSFVTDISYGSVANTGSAKWLKMNFTDLVHGWTSKKFPNYGVVLRSTSEGSAGSYQKYSASETASNKPYLSVTYSDAPSAPTATGYSNSNGTGYFDVSWNKVDGATGYKVLLFNGKAFEEIDVGNVTKWSTKGKKLWPTRAQIDNKQYGLRLNGDGRELPENPNDLYKRSGGDKPNSTNYWFRVKAYNNYGTTSQSAAATPSIPDKTKPTVPGGAQITNDRIDAFTVGWQPSSDLDGSGVTKYKVFIGDQPNVANIESGETTNQYYTVKKALNPRVTYYAWVQAVDKTGNISNNSNIASASARKEFDAQIESYTIPPESNVDNEAGEQLSFVVRNTGTATWTDKHNISLSVTSSSPDNTAPTGFVGYLNTGETIKPNATKTFYVNWKPKKGLIGSYELKAVVGKGTEPTYINPVENIITKKINVKDLAPPSGKMVINDDSKYTTNVNINVKVFDVFDNAIGDKFVQFANGPKGATKDKLSFSDSKKVAQSTEIFPWKLNDTQGEQFVYAQFLDKSGNISGLVSDSIIFDKTIPSITIDNVSNGDYISGTKKIIGSITDNQDNITYQVDYSLRKEKDIKWTAIYKGSSSINGGTIAEWNVSNLPKGEYNLRISATDEAGQTNLEYRTIWIDNVTNNWYGFESYYPTYDLPLLSGNGFVNLYNGSLNISETDYSLSSRGFTLDFGRSYASNRVTKGLLGIGWISNLEEKLLMKDQLVTYVDSDGTEKTFEKLNSTQFKSPPGSEFTLNIIGNQYELDYKDGSLIKKVFDSSGKLLKIVDINGNSILYEYDQGLLKKVISAKKSYSILYNSNNLIEQVIYSTGEKINFTYDNTYLKEVKILTNKGNTAKYVKYYYKENKLSEIEWQNGLKTGFAYNGNRLIQINSALSTRKIDTSRKYPLETYGSIIDTISYDLTTQKILTTINSIYSNKTSKNLANKEFELNEEGFLSNEKVIRTYLENENPDNAKNDTNNISLTTVYENNLVKQTIDAIGNKTEYKYDQYGNIVEKILPAVTINGNKTTYSIKNQYNEYGQMKQSTDTQGKVKYWIYDKNGNLKESIDEEGNKQNYDYDNFGNVIKTIGERGPLYSYIADYSMEDKALTNWTFTGTVKKSTGKAKSGKQSLELSSNASVQSEKVAIKKGRLPVVALIDAIAASSTSSIELKLQYLKNDSIIKEYNELVGLDSNWKKARVMGQVPSDATHVRIQIVNKGTVSIFVDDFVLEESSIVSEYKYDENNEYVIEIIDPYGNKTKYTNNVYGQPLTETNALNQTKTVVYNDKHQVEQVIDRAGRKESYIYDQMGNLLEEVNSLNQKTVYEYNEWGQLLSTKLPKVKMTYYNNEVVDKIVEQQPQLYTEYDELGRLIKETDEKGNILAQEYDGYGRIARVIDPMQNQKYFAYDKNANVIHTIDYAAKEIPNQSDKVLIAKGEMYATYDEWNRQLTETDNTGNKNVLTMINTYDSEDRITQTKDAEGTIFQYKYNALGEEVYSKDNSNPSVETWTYYDGLGTSAITISGSTIEYSVTDANGEVIQTVDQSGKKTVFDYNAAGDKVKQTNPDGTTTEWEYNQEGQIKTETIKSEETSEATTYIVNSYQYNSAGEVDKHKMEGKIINKATNKESKQLLKESDITYDELGRVVREQAKYYEGSSGTVKTSDTRFVFDLNGNLTNKWIYDESSQTISKTGDISLPFVRSESKFEYDANNRFTREEKIENKIITYKTYKDDENAETIYSALGPMVVYYNENDLESKLVTPKNEEYIISYTASELKDTIKGPRLTVDMDYGTNEKMTSIQTKKKDSTNVIFSETYNYNAEEQIIGAKNSFGGDKAYTYTKEGFLETVKQGANTITYSYDVSGNLLKAVDQSGKVLLENEYSVGNRISSSIQYKEDTKKYQKVAYFFRSDGSLSKETYYQLGATVSDAKKAIVDKEKIYDYASINLLKSITTKKGSDILEKIEFTYDSEDNRTSKKVTNSNGERMELYYYDANGDLVSIAQKNGVDLVQNSLNIYRDSTGQLLSFEYKGKTYDYIYNQRGDIIAITNELQEVIAKYTYDEWGNIVKSEGLSDIGKEVMKANPFRYVGKFGVLYDEDTQLYFMGWREYDSRIGRYLVADEYEGEDDNPISFNRYLYAESDPVNNIDPDGYAPKWLKKISKGVKKATKSTYNFVIGDDIKTLKSKNTKWYQKAGAAISIASNFIPGGGLASKAVKIAAKGTSKAVRTVKVTTKAKKVAVRATAKKVSSKVNKKPKTVPSKPIRSAPKKETKAKVKVAANTKPASTKKSTVASKPSRGTVATRAEKNTQKTSSSITKSQGEVMPSPLKEPASGDSVGVAFGNKGTGKYQVGAYKDIKGVEGLDAHHVGQKAAMKKLVDNYDLNTAPAINVPKVGHTIKGPNGIVSRSTKGIDTPRQLLARDIRELRRVYDDIPNSTLKELIELNKKMYPEMRK